MDAVQPARLRLGLLVLSQVKEHALRIAMARSEENCLAILPHLLQHALVVLYNQDTHVLQIGMFAHMLVTHVGVEWTLTGQRSATTGCLMQGMNTLEMAATGTACSRYLSVWLSLNGRD